MLLILIIGKKGKLLVVQFYLLYLSRAIRNLLINIFFFSRHLNGTALGSFVRPAVLITDAYNALNNQPYRRQKDKEFGGNHLFNPVTSAM